MNVIKLLHTVKETVKDLGLIDQFKTKSSKTFILYYLFTWNSSKCKLICGDTANQRLSGQLGVVYKGA